MGRTVGTYRQVLEEMIADFDKFRRALRRADREAFERMMNKARRHSSAASYNVRATPAESMIVSILLEHEKELDAIRRKEGEAADEGLPP
jgi:hypothetical protein